MSYQEAQKMIEDLKTEILKLNEIIQRTHNQQQECEMKSDKLGGDVFELKREIQKLKDYTLILKEGNEAMKTSSKRDRDRLVEANNETKELYSKISVYKEIISEAIGNGK